MFTDVLISEKMTKHSKSIYNACIIFEYGNSFESGLYTLSEFYNIEQISCELPLTCPCHKFPCTSRVQLERM